MNRFSRLLYSLTASRFCSVQAGSSVTKSPLATLRSKTGFPISKCKQALTQHDNDIKAAEKWLFSQAQKEGWVKLEKLQGRAAKQGLIGVIVRGNQAAMVEVNCETDFVARNEKFQTLVSSTAGAILAHSAPGLTDMPSVNHHQREVLSKMALENDTKSLGDFIAESVGYLSENILIARACTMTVTKGLICSYTYNNLSQPGADVAMGTYAALLHLLPKEQDKFDSIEAATKLGRQLCQHIVGLNPLGVDEGDEVKQSQALLHQGFLLDNTITVGGLLEKNGAQVNQFVRYTVGETLSEL